MSTKEEDDVRDALHTLNDAIRLKMEKEFDVTDERVSSQHCRLFKFWCYFWYGHLADAKTGICLRCGKKIHEPQSNKN